MSVDDREREQSLLTANGVGTCCGQCCLISVKSALAVMTHARMHTHNHYNFTDIGAFALA